MLKTHNKNNMGKVLEYFSSLGNISDIQIDSIPMEDVMKSSDRSWILCGKTKGEAYAQN